MAVTRTAERIEVTGVVQGVGFRPFVHRLARELGVDGEVGNDSSRVFMEVAAEQRILDAFVQRLATEAPPLAAIEDITRTPIPREHERLAGGFRIVKSETAAGPRTLVPPDTAVCADCLAELFDPADRRFRHPFITCTNCGPRFTIVTAVPYDRPNTTMSGFEMCAACRSEYEDPADRRYHAQPLACHDCGPGLSYRSADGARAGGETAMAATRSALARGDIVAVKGLGGFHLACDATDPDAVARLRARKQRPDKPFAVMVDSLATAHGLAEIGAAEAAQLTSPARPVVLLRAHASSPISDLVAPDNPLIGVLVAYTPVHHLLLEAPSQPLVMTSANPAGEPIAHRDQQVNDMLGVLADGVLGHDRPIVNPCDDSVVRLMGDTLLPVRRARGYAPIPVRLKHSRRAVLATGGDLKNTFCVASRTHAWLSQHIGDMGSLATLEAFEASVTRFSEMYGIVADCVAVDSHPSYSASQWARRRHPGLVTEVQHHHAHVGAILAEHGLDPTMKVTGFAFDGTGYGLDGTIWGGEVLLADAESFERRAHLAPVRLPGGDSAIQNPYRSALAHLRAAGLAWDEGLAPVAELDEVERRLLDRQFESGFGCVDTTSMGRLFDAVAALLGLRQRISYEAQAAIDLENTAALNCGAPAGYSFIVDSGVVDPGPVLASIVADVRAGRPCPEIAAGFHRAVLEMIVTLAVQISDSGGPSTVALSGGVFQNALLTGQTLAALREAGLNPLTHSVVPPNDGGLALGQAYIAAHRSELAEA